MEDDEETSPVEDVDEDDTFNILIATDIHLGFNEKHPLRGKHTCDHVNF